MKVYTYTYSTFSFRRSNTSLGDFFVIKLLFLKIYIYWNDKYMKTVFSRGVVAVAVLTRFLANSSIQSVQ